MKDKRIDKLEEEIKTIKRILQETIIRSIWRESQKDSGRMCEELFRSSEDEI